MILRSIFKVLKARKVIFTNPAAKIPTGRPETTDPLLLAPAVLRDILDSTDPARAALGALAAFHGLACGQLRALQLTDIRDGRLHLGDRTILLAVPVRARLAGCLDHRQPPDRTPRTRTCSSPNRPHCGRARSVPVGASEPLLRGSRLLPPDPTVPTV